MHDLMKGYVWIASNMLNDLMSVEQIHNFVSHVKKQKEIGYAK